MDCWVMLGALYTGGLGAGSLVCVTWAGTGELARAVCWGMGLNDDL